MTLEDYKTILYRQEDGSWVAEVPAIPGCYGLMATREAALDELSNVFRVLAEEYAENGVALPADTTKIVHAERHGAWALGRHAANKEPPALESFRRSCCNHSTSWWPRDRPAPVFQDPSTISVESRGVSEVEVSHQTGAGFLTGPCHLY